MINNHDMKGKEKEFDCLQKVIKDKNKNEYANNIHELLFAYPIEKYIPNERPDFIYSDNDVAIGIEHCLIDSLYNEHGDSYARKKEHQINKALNDYKKDQDLDKGYVFTTNMVKDAFNYRHNFKYSEFIDKFIKVCKSHNESCLISKENELSYKEKLNSINVNNIVVCLIEIPLFKESPHYALFDEYNNRHTQFINGIPITIDMINEFKKMNGFDYIVICATSNKFIKTYYFDIKNINESIRQQNIHIYNKFDYAKKPEIKAINTVKNGENYDTKFTMTID